MKIEQEDKPDILMMTEPGIIGKIGFNSDGLGACLNFLDSGKQTQGVPIHLILRKILESSSIDSALNSINPYMTGKSANVLIGNSHEQFVDIEFANDEYNVGRNLLQKSPAQSVNDMKDLLLDRSEDTLPICRHYVENPDIGTVGTICTLIMDLKNKQMHLTKGSPLVTPFSIINLEE